MLTGDEISQLLNVNTLHPTYLTKVAIGHMKRRATKGLIVNVSSMMETHPYAGFSVYTATKTFI